MATYDTNSDIIDSLPVDQNIPTHGEIQIVDSIFKQKYSTIQKLLNGLKDILIIGFLFLVCSIPQLEGVIKHFAPSSENSVYIMILIKTFIFMFLYFIVKNIYLIRK